MKKTNIYKKVGLVLMLILFGIVCGFGLDKESWAIGLPGALGIAYAGCALFTKWITED